MKLIEVMKEAERNSKTNQRQARREEIRVKE